MVLCKVTKVEENVVTLKAQEKPFKGQRYTLEGKDLAHWLQKSKATFTLQDNIVCEHNKAKPVKYTKKTQNIYIVTASHREYIDLDFVVVQAQTGALKAKDFIIPTAILHAQLQGQIVDIKEKYLQRKQVAKKPWWKFW